VSTASRVRPLINFPCSKQGVVRYGERHGCSGDRLSVLRRLPERTDNSMADVISGIGKVE